MKKLFVFNDAKNDASEFFSKVFLRLINYEALKGKSLKSSQKKTSESLLEVKLLKV